MEGEASQASPPFRSSIIPTVFCAVVIGPSLVGGMRLGTRCEPVVTAQEVNHGI